jgi:flagellar protein FlgJ
MGREIMEPIAVHSGLAGPLGVSPETLAGRPGAGTQADADQIARDFEGVFVSLVIKEMRQTLEPGTLFGNDTGDSYGGLFDLFLSRHLVDSGGLGIAAMIRRVLEDVPSQ